MLKFQYPTFYYFPVCEGIHTPLITTTQQLSGRRHALVIGASIAGLLAARVLADYFEQVTIIERDHLPESAQVRKGVSQGQHVHLLLNKGIHIKRTGYIFPMENNTWMVTLSGYAHDYPPADEADFLEFAHSLTNSSLEEIYISSKSHGYINIFVAFFAFSRYISW